MGWKWHDIPELLASPNRFKAISHAWHAWAWVPAYPLAGLYRRTLASAPQVVAVVGSLGKTTTTCMLEQILALAQRKRLSTNFGLHLVRQVAALRPRQRAAAIEVGISRQGQMARYASLLRPDVVVVTTLGSDHHLSLGGLEGAFQEKSLMVRALPSDGVVVLNGDDPRVRAMAGLTKARSVFYGLGPQNQVRAENISLDWPQGSSFTLVAPGISQRVTLPLLGEHFILSALAASAVALQLGLGPEEIAASLRRLRPLPGRMHPVELADGIYLIEDHHKGTGETYESALHFLAKVPAKRKVAVLGQVTTPMGSSHKLYKRWGALAGQGVDLLLTLGTSSTCKSLAAGARKAGLAEENIVQCGGSVQTVAQELRRRLQPGDVVLLKARRDQQLRRVTLMLQGRPVSCSIKQCKWVNLVCDECGLLEKSKPRGG